MDEPSAVLASDEVDNLFRVIRDLTTEGVAVIYISHRLEEIRRIGDRITDVPGSSEYFLLGVAAYAYEAKTAVLGVPAELLARHGAVSTEVAEAMAEGVRRASGASLAVSTTGVAGPGGGTAEKPVGTVCIGLAWEGGRWSRRYDLGARGRDWVKTITAVMALDRVRRWLLDPENAA